MSRIEESTEYSVFSGELCENLDYIYNKLKCGDREVWNRVLFLADNSCDPFAQAVVAIGYHDGFITKSSELSRQYAEKCLPWLLQQTDHWAYFCLGTMYSRGIGVQADTEKSGYYASLGVEHNALCQCGYGFYCEIAKFKCEEAFEWYKRSAETGYCQAQFNVSSCYNHGVGVAKDYKEAMKWCRMAAEQGLPDALYNVGAWYYDGHDEEEDPEAVKAIGWHRDYIEAFHWFSLAAERGDGEAQACMGLIYEHGHGAVKNLAESVKWYRLSAEQGVAESQYYLGQCYELGKGDVVQVDLHEACRWYQLASDKHCPKATKALRRLAGQFRCDVLAVY